MDEKIKAVSFRPRCTVEKNRHNSYTHVAPNALTNITTTLHTRRFNPGCREQASGEMDSMKFFKLMGDCGLTGKSLSRTDCDLIFTKTCSASGCVKKIHYDAFRKVCVLGCTGMYVLIGCNANCNGIVAPTLTSMQRHCAAPL